jgi:uncharacterized protein YacL
MKGKPQRNAPMGFIPGTRNLTGVLVLLIFCVTGALIFGSAGPGALELLFSWLTNNVFRSKITAQPEDTFRATAITMVPLGLLGIILGALVGSRFLRAMERLGMRWDRMDAADKVTLFVGIFAGLIASVPLIQIFSYFQVEPIYRILLILGVTVGFSALSVYVLQNVADLLPWNRGPIRGKRSGIKILDTNVIIDGRIYDIAKAGFLEGQLYVPQFVLEELQYIADSHDTLRRQRGRRGLEVLKHIQADFPLEVGVHDRFASDTEEEVDARIVRLARALAADVVTNDFNLNRVATLQGVRVLSLNDLALALRTSVLPEETLQLKVVREGNQLGQGVGYLEDGTMVVIEGGQGSVGDVAEVIVTQVIQTERGKMIFAEMQVSEETQPSRRRNTPRRAQG